MLALVIEAPGRAGFRHLPDPQPGPGEVLIAVAAAGICGTDGHIFDGAYEAAYPIIPGHEFSGTVAAVGEGATRFRVGDRVTADPNLPCGGCPACQRNEPNQCHHLQAVGVTRNGAFADFVLVPEPNVFAIGELPFDQAALTEPLACVVWGLRRVQVQPGDEALVFGAGPMGCLIIQGLLRSGAARVVVTDPVASRLAFAAQLGAVPVEAARLHGSAPLGYDVVVEASGRVEAVEQALSLVRPRGKVWLFGVCPLGDIARFEPYEVFRRDLTIVGSFAVCRTFAASLAMLQHGAVRVEPLISHRFPLEQALEAWTVWSTDPERRKVLLLPNTQGGQP